MRHLKFVVMALFFVVMALPSYAGVEIGNAAPDFTALDVNGNVFKLSDHKGKIVVLEWTNHKCPFVIKHYSTGNMQRTQRSARDKGVEWVSIVSSAPGRQGHTDAETAKRIMAEKGSYATTKILDESGEIGRLYGARTTPHMFVISADGNVVYAGAIDDKPSPRHSTVEGANNYVLAALDDLAAGRDVAVSQTAPYGCAVKYAY